MQAQTIHFRKMNGLGNDFVVLDARARALGLSPEAVRAIADRKEGIGCDQIIAIETSQQADVFMRIWNADGGEVGACGNAARCVAALVAAEPGAVCPRTPEDISAKKKDWPLRLASLGADAAAGALRLSKGEARVQEELRVGGTLAEVAYRLGEARARQVAVLRASRGADLRADWREEIAFAAGQRFPLTAADVMPPLHGAAVGRGLRAAEAAWIESGFLMPAPGLIDVALLAGETT